MRKTLLALVAIAALSVFSAAHATIAANEMLFTPSSAVGSGSDHSLWIQGGVGAGIGSDFDFIDGGPAQRLFALEMGGGEQAILVGRVESQDKAGTGFDILFLYDNNYPFLGGPQFKSENGSAEVLGQTIFRDLELGIMVGYGMLEGLELSVERRPADGPYATQIGPSNGMDNGANNKNMNYGMAHWFTMTVEENDCMICKDISDLNGRQGDINVDLTKVPVPAPLALMLSGLAGLLGFSRRSK
jgi:hypothetical protein